MAPTRKAPREPKQPRKLGALILISLAVVVLLSAALWFVSPMLLQTLGNMKQPAVQTAILVQPSDAFVSEGETATVYLTASGQGLRYEWWLAAPGSDDFQPTEQADNVFFLPMTAEADGSRVYCTVTDAKNETVSSSVVTLGFAEAGALQPPPAEVVISSREFRITEQPQDALVREGEMISISVRAEGEDLTYQWWYRNAGSESFVRSDITSPDYHTQMYAGYDGRLLYCVVTAADGSSLTTETVTLTLDRPIVITRQPESAQVRAGSTIPISVAAEGDGLTYQWWYLSKGGAEYVKSEITTPDYATSMYEAYDGRQIYCIITDSDGNTLQTDTVTLTLDRPIIITRQPEDAAVKEGDTIPISVSAEGDGLTYQWWYLSKGSTDYVKSEITAPDYATRMYTAYDGRLIYCIITDSEGNTIQTDTVTLTLEP